MDNLVKDLQETLEKLDNKIEEFQQKVNSVLDKIPGWVPDFIVDKVISAWNKFCDACQMSLEGYWLLLDQVGEPWTLRAGADTWSNSVGGPVSEKVSTVDAGLLLVDDNWTGTAATAYKNVLPLQKAALTAIKKDFTDTLQQSLDKVATAINVFVAACIAALVALTAAIVTAILGIAGVVTAPPAIIAAVAAVGTAAAAYFTAKTNLDGVGQDAESSMRLKLNELTAFPNGAWPKAVI